MKISIFSENSWLYKESEVGRQQEAYLHTARNSDVGFQVLGEALQEPAEVTLKMTWEGQMLVEPQYYEMIDIGVDENTDVQWMTTTDYTRCQDFVTKQAPFRVYDALKPVSDTFICRERLALFVALPIGREVKCGDYRGILSLTIQGEEHLLAIHCTVYVPIISDLETTKLGMLNFFSYPNIAMQHGVNCYGESYWNLFRAYSRSQLDMRCTHIMLPPPMPVYDTLKQVIDFDFTPAIRAGTIALEEGAQYIVGAPVAVWSEGAQKGYFLAWDRTVPTESLEAYWMLKLYFEKWAMILKEKHWENRVMQSLADEPQVHNSARYRALSCICRRFLPQVPVIEAVETFELGGAVDIWVPKQDFYEKSRKTFEVMQEKGETIWFYTCAFPAGKIMNRSMDLPLLVSRYILWLGFKYGLKGFLHWGFNYYEGPNLWDQACCDHKGAKLPAGDAHIVYPGKDEVWQSMRYRQQRAGARDYELLCQLKQLDESLAYRLVETLCQSFRDYIAQAHLFESVYIQLLQALSTLSKE